MKNRTGQFTKNALALSPALLAAVLFLAPTFLAPASLNAQRRGFASSGRAGAIPLRGNVRAGFIGPNSTRLRPAGRYIGGAGYASPFYSDPGYDGSVLVTPQLFASDFAPEAAQPLPPARPSEALVVQLQGDRWVRINPYGSQTIAPADTPEPAANPPSAITAARTHPTAAQPAASPVHAPLPSAVLVFRDGHQEEIGQYRIMGATIYIHTDYWTSGAWTRTVPVTALDVPATLKLNQQRGANFRLPSSPDEVMIGG